MAGMRFTLEFDDETVARALGELVRRGADLSPAMAEIAQAGETSTLHRFETETGPDGSPWRPSLRATEENGQTLTDSAQLRNSISSRFDATSAEWGSNKIYAPTHQFGATIRAKTARGLRFKIGNRWVVKQSVTIPPRPFLGINEDDQSEIRDILRDHITGLIS
jgi:phage virion morphogenesis protein